MNRFAPSACIALALLLLAACDPPGKPKPEPLSSRDITDFAFLYNENCAGCHGADGKNGPGRILNDPLYLAVMPREELQNTIENGRPGTAMPAWGTSKGGPLTPKQVTALVDGIYGNWSKPSQFQGAALPPYSAGDDHGDPAHGKALFTRDCFMCHGPGARIGVVTSASFLQLSTDQFLRTSVIVGRPDLGMPDYRHLNMGRALSNQDIADLVAYLGSLRPTAPVTGTHTNDSGTGETGPMVKGNEGSGSGPGSRHQERNEGSAKNTNNSSEKGVR